MDDNEHKENFENYENDLRSLGASMLLRVLGWTAGCVWRCRMVPPKTPGGLIFPSASTGGSPKGSHRAKRGFSGMVAMGATFLETAGPLERPKFSG